VLLGAGLDTFAQRRPELAAQLRVFEVDQPGTQAWKRRRLTELGYGIPDWLRLVPVDFEAGASWRQEAAAAGFDARAAGFADVRHVSGRDMNERYFAGRPDGLRMSTGEDFLIATT